MFHEHKNSNFVGLEAGMMKRNGIPPPKKILSTATAEPNKFDQGKKNRVRCERATY